MWCLFCGWRQIGAIVKSKKRQTNVEMRAESERIRVYITKITQIRRINVAIDDLAADHVLT
jgi:translation initiation factor 1 (eIF-1/SUI1)